MVWLIILAKSYVCETVKSMKAEELVGLHKIVGAKSRLNSSPQNRLAARLNSRLTGEVRTNPKISGNRVNRDFACLLCPFLARVPLPALQLPAMPQQVANRML
jgi:hypothetical protein